jgi:hypothetical protein
MKMAVVGGYFQSRGQAARTIVENGDEACTMVGFRNSNLHQGHRGHTGTVELI